MTLLQTGLVEFLHRQSWGPCTRKNSGLVLGQIKKKTPKGVRENGAQRENASRHTQESPVEEVGPSTTPRSIDLEDPQVS